MSVDHAIAAVGVCIAIWFGLEARDRFGVAMTLAGPEDPAAVRTPGGRLADWMFFSGHLLGLLALGFAIGAGVLIGRAL